MNNSEFAKSVWDNLSKTDVNKHVEKKNGLSYLSWAWAWQVLMNNYPESSYEILPIQYLENKTALIWVEVEVKQGENSLKRRMWLAVMDFRNKPVASPTATDIANSTMRCLVKAISMFGLGAYIYAGEDVPQENDIQREPVKESKPKSKEYDELIKLMNEQKDSLASAKANGIITHDRVVEMLKSVNASNLEQYQDELIGAIKSNSELEGM